MLEEPFEGPGAGGGRGGVQFAGPIPQRNRHPHHRVRSRLGAGTGRLRPRVAHRAGGTLAERHRIVQAGAVDVAPAARTRRASATSLARGRCSRPQAVFEICKSESCIP